MTPPADKVDQLPPEVLNAARRMLDEAGGQTEANLQNNICILLNRLNIEYLIQFDTGNGYADIYLHRRRVIIEVKTAAAADRPDDPQAGREGGESPFEQVSRYVFAERARELEMLPLEDNPPNLRWTAIVTDGRVWHARQFDHDNGHRQRPHEVFSEPLRPTGPNAVERLLERLLPVFSVEPAGKPWIPAEPFDEFSDDLSALRDHYQLISARGGRGGRGAGTKMELWLDMLRGSGMEPAAPARAGVFADHCALVALARGVIHTLTQPSQDPDPSELLKDGFAAWILDLEEGREWARGLLRRVCGFEWRRTPGDVLRPLYERFIDKDERQDFGEFYTPDWLAELMVKECLDDEWRRRAVSAALSEMMNQGSIQGIGALDPTCGSGTFLLHAARRLLSDPELAACSPVRRADAVCRLIHGIDIHPVAAEFSRATLLRALPAAPSGGNAALSIYQGDALMVRQIDDGSLFAAQNGELRFETPGGRDLTLPRPFTELPEFPEMLRRITEAAVEGRHLAEDIRGAAQDDAERNMIDEFHESLTEVISEEGNSVWTWYITNVVGPDRLANRKVDRIVANPPWVKLANIQSAQRKRTLENLAKGDGAWAGLRAGGGVDKDDAGGARTHMVRRANLWGGGKQAPHFDIAQIFVRDCRHLYMRDPESNPAAWLVKAAAVKGGNWDKFRRWHTGVLAQSLDLSAVQVFGPGDARRCCVLFERRPVSEELPGGVEGLARIRAEASDIRREDAGLTWPEVSRRLTWAEQFQFPRHVSAYSEETWRQGATITPKVLTIAAEIGPGTQAGAGMITTARSSQPGWKTVRSRSGDVPRAWLTPLLTSGNVLPFRLSGGQVTAVLPRSRAGALLAISEARRNPFWRELDDLWRERTGTSSPRTLLDRLDYGKALAKQLPPLRGRGVMVVYPASGDYMRAAHIPAAGGSVIDTTLYWRAVRNVTEARYLTGLLNAPALQSALQECRRSGRHFHKNPWRAVPIPMWDPENAHHRRIAALSLRAERAAMALNDLPAGQIAASERIRRAVADQGIAEDLDTHVRAVLPEHAN